MKIPNPFKKKPRQTAEEQMQEAVARMAMETGQSVTVHLGSEGDWQVKSLESQAQTELAMFKRDNTRLRLENTNLRLALRQAQAAAQARGEPHLINQAMKHLEQPPPMDAGDVAGNP